ncbi:hypothetical protein [Abditibacterium utsteinense]|nr:hypothetical protein [Abditibacterium utsteinense]
MKELSPKAVTSASFFVEITTSKPGSGQVRLAELNRVMQYRL